jgi:hypothetical protein
LTSVALWRAHIPIHFGIQIQDVGQLRDFDSPPPPPLPLSSQLTASSKWRQWNWIPRLQRFSRRHRWSFI